MICTDAEEVDSEQWVEPNTDAMRWGVTTTRMPRLSCTAGPSVTVDKLRDSIPELTAGFREVLVPLTDPARVRVALAALPALGPFLVRRVHRPTRVYSLLLREASGPAELADRMRRDEVFDRLRSLPLPAVGPVEPAVVLESELAQLRHGDIPYFSESTDPTSASSDGWRARLNEITPTAIDCNLNVITAAMIAKFPGPVRPPGPPTPDDAPQTSPPDLTALVVLTTEVVSPVGMAG